MLNLETEITCRKNVEIQAIESIPDLKIIYPKIFPDERGFFCESYNIKEWSEMLNFNVSFKQDNQSFSKYGVIRGLHTQPGMGKLVSVISGKIFDVAVDIRPGSSTFGKWYGVVLDEKTKNMFWIPDGFLHGFQCISKDGANVFYKCSEVYNQETEYGINPFDKKIGVKWPITDQNNLIISKRDQQHPNLDSIL